MIHLINKYDLNFIALFFSILNSNGSDERSNHRFCVLSRLIYNNKTWNIIDKFGVLKVINLQKYNIILVE